MTFAVCVIVVEILTYCKGKASGEDGIVYEHIMFAGEILHKVLAILFSAMINLVYVPAVMKKGAIITLYKGGNKSKDNPDSYRAITLSSVLLKTIKTPYNFGCSEGIRVEKQTIYGNSKFRAGRSKYADQNEDI